MPRSATWASWPDAARRALATAAAALCLAAGAGAGEAAGMVPCERCAVVEQVRRVARQGEPAALGAAPGQRLGDGAAPAGLNPRRHSVWVTTVRLGSGKSRSFESPARPALRPGDVVVVEDATLRRHIPEPGAR